MKVWHYIFIFIFIVTFSQWIPALPKPLSSEFNVCDKLVVTSELYDFSNLNIVLLGDSETSIGGDLCDKPRGWNKWFAEALKPASCRSYARSGATWTNTTNTKKNCEEETGILGDDNVIYNQVERLKAAVEAGKQVAPQLIIIAAGTNDAWFQKRRPGIFEINEAQAFSKQDAFITDRKVNTITSLAESIRYNCELLMEAFPDAQIILITPMQAVAIETEEVMRVADVIETCGKWLNVGVVRMDAGGSLYRPREKMKHKFTYDGTHTNEKGARRNGRYIARQVASMLQF